MLRLLAIVVLCFAFGYWVITKLFAANGAKSFRDGMADPNRRADTEPDVRADSRDAASSSNWHLILDVDRHASKDAIKAAYKRQMGLYHPDKVAALGAEIRAVANAKAAQINAAYDIAVRDGFA